MKLISKITISLLGFLISSLGLLGAAKPNILVIIADDCTFSDLPLNGGQNAKTPHLDALAKQSLVFDRAYLGMAMCSPCRSELYTGRLPFRNGCAWNHGTVRPDTNLTDDTLVLFTSEQGAQFPGCKWTNWDNGLHTTLIARWPKNIPAAKRSKAIVQYADVLPTLINLAGGTPDPEIFDGSPFSDVLLGKSEQHRDFAYGMHNNFPEGPPYPIRSVTNGDWRYIRNLSPENLYIEKHLMGRNEHNPYWQTWVFSSFDKPHHQFLVERFMKRPAEELYHTSEDRFEMTNLATHPAHAEIKKQLAAALDKTLQDQRDPGVPLDTKKAHRASAAGQPAFPSKP